MDETVTHLAGPVITVSGRVLQRCCICGEKLCDNARCAMALNPDGSAPEFPTWEPGQLIRVTSGNPTHYAVISYPIDNQLPKDSCIDLVEV